jgi:cyclophilin family peptidyl-prolyl cis-trans isomerase
MGAEELPSLPLSVNGSLAMARGIEDGTSSATQFFVYQFDKKSAGLGGLAFEEGEFSVFGYVVKGEAEGFLKQLSTGDTIVSAKIVDGYDRLLNATTRSAPAVSVEGPTGADAVVRAPTE